MGGFLVEGDCPPRLNFELRNCVIALSGAEAGSRSYVSATAFRASQPPLDLRNLPRPIPALAEQRDLHRMDDGDPLAGSTLDPQHVAVPRIV